MDELEVIDNDAPPGHVSDDEQPSDKGKGGSRGKEKDETVTLTKRELESLRRERDELRTSERAWAERAMAAGGKPAAAEEEEEEEDDEPGPDENEDPDKLVNDIASKGIKALVSRGFMTKKDAKAIIEKVALKAARQVVGQASRAKSTEDTVFGEFPELKDNKSELFKLTSIEMQRLTKIDPNAANSAVALYSAASLAKAKLGATKPAKGRNGGRAEYEYEGDDYEDEQEEDETDRRRRVDAQGPTRGRGARETVQDDDYVSPSMRRILEAMHPERSDEERNSLARMGRAIIRNGGQPLNQRRNR